jgi:hypothetical protein
MNTLCEQKGTSGDGNPFMDEDEVKANLGRMVHQAGNWSKWICRSSDLLTFCVNWAYNRKVNVEHVERMRLQLLAATHRVPYFIGSFKFVQNSSGSLRLVDGQHRLHVLMALKAEKPEFDMDVDCDVYQVSDLNGVDAQQIFADANNIIALRESDSVDANLAQTLDLLCNMYPKSIKDASRVNYPNLRRADIYNKLMELKIPCTDPRALYSSIMQLNAEYAKKGSFKMYCKSLDAKDFKKFEVALAKAKDHTFYLGVLRLEWVKEIKY